MKNSQKETAEYMAESFECDKSMTSEEIAKAIQDNIKEHISIYNDVVHQLLTLKTFK